MALRLGGTVSGEHGIGVLKRGWLSHQWAPAPSPRTARSRTRWTPRGCSTRGRSCLRTSSFLRRERGGVTLDRLRRRPGSLPRCSPPPSSAAVCCCPPAAVTTTPAGLRRRPRAAPSGASGRATRLPAAAARRTPWRRPPSRMPTARATRSRRRHRSPRAASPAASPTTSLRRSRDPRLHALGLRQARVTVSWDLAVRGPRPGAAPDAARFPALADEHARAAGVARGGTPRRADGSSSRSALRAEAADRAVAGALPRGGPALLRWLDRIGYGKSIEAVSPWNEPNLSGRDARTAGDRAGYFDEVRSLCATRGCTPVAGEFADRPADASTARRYAARSRPRRRRSGHGTPTRTAGIAARRLAAATEHAARSRSRPRRRSG